MRSSSSLSRSVLLLTVLLAGSVGCGSSENAGTYVRLSFSGTVSRPNAIKSIVIDLTLGSRTSSTTFEGPTGRNITLDTDAILEIQSGDGLLTVTARALDAAGLVLGTGTGSGVVVRNKTIGISIMFGGEIPDAAIDGSSGIDGSPSFIDTARDAAMDRPLDGPTGLDGPLGPDGVRPGDLPAELGDGQPDRPIDVPGTGGAGGTDAPGLGGTGGVASGTGGAGTGGVGIGQGGSTGMGGATTPDAPPAVPLLIATPPSIDFGVILPGNTSTPQTFTIINRGDAPTPPLTTFVSNPTLFPIAADTCKDAVLNPGGTCAVTFVFLPTAPGLVQAEGAVAPAAGGAQAKFQLSGTGAGGPATLTVSPPSVALPPTDVTTSSSVTFTLTNGGDTEAGSISIQVPGAPVFQLTANGCGTGSLGPRSQCAFTVAFAPVTFGPAAATITVLSSLGLSTSAALSGTGRDFVPLTIGFAGTGKGTVSGGPQPCPAGAPCTFSIPRTDPANLPQFVLTAQPNAFTTFDGWSGACTGTGTCAVVMDQPRAVTAGFTQQMATLNLTVLGLAGQTGALLGPDGTILCKDTCPGLSLPATNAFTLTAQPASTAFTFAAWTAGPCKGVDPKCTFPLTGPVSIVATFGPQGYAFVTSSTVIPGKLGGIEAGDKVCQELAGRAGLPGKYLAWLSTTTTAAGRRIGEGGWIRTDGRPFAYDLKSLIDSSYLAVLYPLRLDEKGTDLGNVRIPVATGSGADGNPIGTQCADYTNTTGSLTVGDASSGHTVWTNRSSSSTGCGDAQRLYCFRADTSQAVVAPAAQPGRRVFTSTLPFVMGTTTIPPDEVCWKDADAGGIADPKSFVAFLSTSSASALSRVDLKGPPWKRLDGVFVVNQTEDLATMRLLAPIDAAADGKSYLVGGVWTGAKEPRALGTATCGDWGMSRFEGRGIIGDSPTSSAPDWFGHTDTPCNSTTTRLICIER